MLLRLRQACDDPRLITMGKQASTIESEEDQENSGPVADMVNTVESLLHQFRQSEKAQSSSKLKVLLDDLLYISAWNRRKERPPHDLRQATPALVQYCQSYPVDEPLKAIVFSQVLGFPHLCDWSSTLTCTRERLHSGHPCWTLWRKPL